MASAYEINLLCETGGGGVARHVFDLYRGLKLRGRIVRLIVSLRRADPLYRAELATIDPADVYQIDLRRRPSVEDIVAAAKLRHYLRNRARPQVVHAHSTKAGAIAALLRSRKTATLFTPHAYRGMDPTLPGWQKVMVTVAEKYLSNAHRKVIATCPEEYAYARRLGISGERLSLVVNGVDLQAVREVGRQSRMAGCGGVCAVGFVGRLVHQKNPITFLKALSVMKASGFPFHGHIVGDGPLRPMLEKYARDTGLADDLTFYGTVNNIPILANCDLLVHTSLYEACPYSLLEAVALGIPIVAVTNAGTEAIFGERLRTIEGHLKYGEIADTAMKIFRDPGAREEIRATYKHIEREISIEAMVDKIEGVYNTLW
jgi:glycosyltransferase involved in cell wall biosynthesis